MCLQSTRLSARRPLSCSRWQGGRHFREHYGARHGTGGGAGPGQKLAAKPIQPLSAADAAAANGVHACPHRCLGTFRPHSQEGRSLVNHGLVARSSSLAQWPTLAVRGCHSALQQHRAPLGWLAIRSDSETRESVSDVRAGQIGAVRAPGKAASDAGLRPLAPCTDARTLLRTPACVPGGGAVRRVKHVE